MINAEQFLDRLTGEIRKFRPGSPLTVVFADWNYRQVLDNWLAAVRRFGLDSYLVFALDENLFSDLESRAEPVMLLDFSGSLPDLWRFRVRILRQIVQAGLPVIHSDADAIWLRDPRPYCARESAGYDMLFSQGTIHPRNTWAKTGFVFCCGFFGLNPTPQVMDFLLAVEDHVEISGDDQTSFNELLLGEDVDISFAEMDPYEITFRNKRINCFRYVLPVSNRIYGLRAGLLPQHLFQRVSMPKEDAFVKHFVTPKDAAAKLASFRDEGLLYIGTEQS